MHVLEKWAVKTVFEQHSRNSVCKMQEEKIELH